MNLRKINIPLKKFFNSRVKALEAPLKILLVGNPNTGKTTLFNSLTKSNEHVGNWHGVTVSEKEKPFSAFEKKFVLVDLPGLYSLTPLSYEEEVASKYIFENSSCPIINICDINNLKRNLFLTLQLKEVSSEIILFVNTFQNIKNNKTLKEKIKQAESALKKLDVKFFIGNAENKKDIQKFKKLLLNLKLNTNNQIKKIENKYKKENNLNFLHENREAFLKINSCFGSEIKEERAYGNSKLDKILLNKYLALPIFFGILFLVFYLTFFSLGAALSDLLRELIQNVIGGQIVSWLRSVCSVAWVVDLVETGIIGGVGSILSFLPQVILLFFFLSLIEDSGYLARVAFLFEDIFAKVGLSGKSVYSLLMGFGCSTTAALTARNMEDKNAKIKTAILTPYMSCSAKLPIYAVIGGAFFGASNVLIIFGLYMLGVVVAILLSLFLEQKVLKSKAQSFILEFPAYRIPSPKRTFKILWENVKLFLIRIGTVIFSLNLIVWLLQSFSFGFKFVPTEGGTSMLKAIGTVIAPIFIPLGFGNWGAASALIAGLAAKEIIVSSIAMFNGVDVLGDSMKSQTMRSITSPLSVVFFTPASALSFMVFCLLYSPCLATISVFKKEIGGKWTAISVALQFAIAYILALLTYNIYRLVEGLGAVNSIFIFLGLGLIIICSCYLYFKFKKRNFCSYCKDKSSCKNCRKK
mgnify:FL=1